MYPPRARTFEDWPHVDHHARALTRSVDRRPAGPRLQTSRAQRAHEPCRRPRHLRTRWTGSSRPAAGPRPPPATSYDFVDRPPGPRPCGTPSTRRAIETELGWRAVETFETGGPSPRRPSAGISRTRRGGGPSASAAIPASAPLGQVGVAAASSCSRSGLTFIQPGLSPAGRAVLIPGRHRGDRNRVRTPRSPSPRRQFRPEDPPAVASGEAGPGRLKPSGPPPPPEARRREGAIVS